MEFRTAFLLAIASLMLAGCGNPPRYEVIAPGAGLSFLKPLPPPAPPTDWFQVGGGSTWYPTWEQPGVAIRHGGPLFSQPPEDLRKFLNHNLPKPLSSRTRVLRDPQTGWIYLNGTERDTAALLAMFTAFRTGLWTERRVSARAFRIPAAELEKLKSQAGKNPAELERLMKGSPQAVHLAEVLSDLPRSDDPFASSVGSTPDPFASIPAPFISGPDPFAPAYEVSGNTEVTWPVGFARLQVSVQHGPADTNPVTAQWHFAISSAAVAAGSATIPDGETSFAETPGADGQTIAVFSSWTRHTNWEIQPRTPGFEAEVATWRKHGPELKIDDRPEAWIVQVFGGIPFLTGYLPVPIEVPELQSAFATGDLFDYRPHLRDQGIIFPPGSLALWDSSTGRLFMRQTEDQLDMCEAYFQPYHEYTLMGPHIRWVGLSQIGEAAPRVLSRTAIRALPGNRISNRQSLASGAKVTMEALTGIYYGADVKLQAELPVPETGGAVILSTSTLVTNELDQPVAVLGHGPGAIRLISRWQMTWEDQPPGIPQSELAEVLEKVAARLSKP